MYMPLFVPPEKFRTCHETELDSENLGLIYTAPI